MKTYCESLRMKLLAVALVFTSSLTWFAQTASAVPSMARQTGYECARCHTVFPELTPFGREFKLGAFAMSSQEWDERAWKDRIPLAGAIRISQTNTSNATAGGTEPEEFELDREPVLQTLAVYYGGKIANNAGALIQYNYDGIERLWAMEMFDLRYANGFSLGEKEVTYGVSLNNNPTVSDIYNSTPAWSFPYAGTAAPQAPASTLVDMMLASQAGGVTAYALWNDLLYTEVGFYRTAATGAFRFLGAGVPNEVVLTGTNPYWRVALQKESGKHSVELGTYGLRADVLLDPDDASVGTARFEDYALDASYQYIDGDHIFATYGTWIREKRRSDAGVAQGLASNASGTLKTLRVDAHYFFRRQWGGALQYFSTSGSQDALIYDNGDAISGSASASPDTRGWIAEANYLPTDQVKMTVRYTAFEKYNGASSNYVPGRDASDNDNVFFLGWILF